MMVFHGIFPFIQTHLIKQFQSCYDLEAYQSINGNKFRLYTPLFYYSNFIPFQIQIQIDPDLNIRQRLFNLCFVFFLKILQSRLLVYRMSRSPKMAISSNGRTGFTVKQNKIVTTGMENTVKMAFPFPRLTSLLLQTARNERAIATTNRYTFLSLNKKIKVTSEHIVFNKMLQRLITLLGVSLVSKSILSIHLFIIKCIHNSDHVIIIIK